MTGYGRDRLMRQMRGRAYRAGQDARRLGLPITANPYSPALSNRWIAGWKEIDGSRADDPERTINGEAEVKS